MDNLDMLQGDFNLDDIVEVSLDIDGKPMPPKNNKIALIDADTIAYTACLNVEVAGEILGEDFYSEDEWQAILNDPQYVSGEGILYSTDPSQALAKAKEKINRMLDKTGCQTIELHFTGGRENFRYSVSPTYKANRIVRAPAGLYQLKLDLLKEYAGAIHTSWEADDMVVYLKLAEPEKYILCAVDKDVLNSIEGTHFNYYESLLYGKEMKWQDTDKYTATTWMYIQTLTGDITDNIYGIKGVGPAKAAKIIAGCTTHKEMWQTVCRAYENTGRTKDEALMNLNLVDMQLLYLDDGLLRVKLRTHEELLK